MSRYLFEHTAAEQMAQAELTHLHTKYLLAKKWSRYRDNDWFDVWLDYLQFREYYNQTYK